MPLALTMRSSNVTVLTQSHAVAAKKRKAKRGEVQEVVFDDEARQCVIPKLFLMRNEGSI